MLGVTVVVFIVLLTMTIPFTSVSSHKPKPYDAAWERKKTNRDKPPTRGQHRRA